MSDLSKELRAALDDPTRYEWGEGPWEHLGDAERDVRRLLDEIEAAERELARLQERANFAELLDLLCALLADTPEDGAA